MSLEESARNRRRSVLVAQQGLADLDWLVGSTESSEAIVVDRAIRIFRMIVEAQQAGQKVLFRDPLSGEMEELLLL